MKHEFIMLKYDDIPQSVMCTLRKGHDVVEVDDEIIIGNPYLVYLGTYKKPQHIPGFKTFLVSFTNEADGLAYHGNTIIPTSSLPKFIRNIELTKKELDSKAYEKALARRKLKKEDCLKELDNLIELCQSAIEQNKYVIHFGI